MSERSPKIYQVEDNLDFATYAGVLLRTLLNAEVTHFSDGLKGLQGCLSGEPDIILLDLELPSLRGEEICRMLRSSKYHRHLPIIVCSSMPEPERRELELLQIGANRYLPKPVDDAALLAAIRELLPSGARGSLPSPVQMLDAGLPETREPGRGEQRPDEAQLDESLDLPPGKPDSSAGHAPSNEVTVHRPRAEVTPDQIFAGYRIIQLLGSGGMGTVYQAIDLETGNLVALKVMLAKYATHGRLVERFRRESLIMSELEHENIVRVYGSGETDYTLYFAMEYVDGGSIQDRIEKRNLTWEDCCIFTRQMFEAVAYLHSRGVIHRDIKPPNVLLTSNGTVKLADFGVSRQGSPLQNHELTRSGAMIGTPRYMAPEVLAGAAATQLSDQFSLGRTIMHMLEGPVMSFPPKPLHDIRPDLPLPLSRALARCMDVHPSMRYPTLQQAREAILEYCH